MCISGKNKFGVLTISKEKLKQPTNQLQFNPNDLSVSQRAHPIFDSDRSRSDEGALTQPVTATTLGGPLRERK